MLLTVRNLYHARPRLFIALAIGIAAGLAIPLHSNDAVMRALIGWNVAAWAYLLFIWTMMLRTDGDDVRAHAKRQDEKAWVILAALTLAAAMSMIAIVIELAGAKASGDRGFHIAMAGSTVLCSWLLIPTAFGLHYAHEYYQDERRRKTLIFPDADHHHKPDYWDFMYFSFTIAVAFATSDIQVPRATRRLVLAQSVLSFFFNAGILALSINVSASLVSG